MTAAPETASPQETGSALVIAVHENPGIVLLDEARFERFYEAVKDEVSRFVPDLTTAKGRDEITSMAFKVTKTKTAIDAAGKALKEEAEKTVKSVDKARRTIRERLEALAEEVRAPLTEWKVRETLRLEKVEGILSSIRTDAVVTTEDTAEGIIARLERLEALTFDEAVMADRVEEAEELRAGTVASLETVLQRIQQEERDRAELEALRAEKAEAERRQAEKVAAYDAAKAAQKEAAEAEARELERQQEAERAAAAERERIASAAKAAAEEAEAKAKAEADRKAREQEAEHQRALDAEKRRADEAEAARKAEADAAEAQRRADAARAADQEHRGRIMGAAKEAIMLHGPSEEHARAIVLAIAAGLVPAVSIRF